jgi:hypothetical protein
MSKFIISAEAKTDDGVVVHMTIGHTCTSKHDEVTKAFESFPPFCAEVTGNRQFGKAWVATLNIAHDIRHYLATRFDHLMDEERNGVKHLWSTDKIAYIKCKCQEDANAMIGKLVWFNVFTYGKTGQPILVFKR